VWEDQSFTLRSDEFFFVLSSKYSTKQKALFDANPDVKAAWKLKVSKWNACYRLKRKMKDGWRVVKLLLSEQQNLFVDEYERDAGENDNEI
jgi:hypothetical protein